MASSSKFYLKNVVDLVTDVIDNLYSSHEELDELLRLQNEVTVYDSQSSSEGDSDNSAINVSTIHRQV